MDSEDNVDTSFKSDPFYGSGWDTIGQLNPTGNFVQNGFSNSHYSTVNYPSESGLANMTPGFGSGSYSEMVTCFQTPDVGCHPDYANSGDGVVGVSPNGNRKRKASIGASPKSLIADVQLQTEDDDKEQRCEQNVGANSRNKQVMKQAKDNSVNAEPSKENYIHMRAKRGQATNSHSLAERVRRERISERMKLLQELVPGCNKITGKAVMLDEIINYVQSLQQQVEFLSMKLATVNPELDVDIDRILSKDILQFRGNNPAAALGISHGLNLSNPFPGAFPTANPPFHQLPQSLWNNDFQSLLQMGFDANTPGQGSNLGSNGHSKMEL